MQLKSAEVKQKAMLMLSGTERVRFVTNELFSKQSQKLELQGKRAKQSKAWARLHWNSNRRLVDIIVPIPCRRTFIQRLALRCLPIPCRRTSIQWLTLRCVHTGIPGRHHCCVPIAAQESTWLSAAKCAAIASVWIAHVIPSVARIAHTARLTRLWSTIVTCDGGIVHSWHRDPTLGSTGSGARSVRTHIPHKAWAAVLVATACGRTVAGVTYPTRGNARVTTAIVACVARIILGWDGTATGYATRQRFRSWCCRST